MGNILTNCSEELKRFIQTIAKEANEEKQDGLLGKLLQVSGGEREVYEFIVAEGYNVTYDEFLEYYKACQVGFSVMNSELSEDELDSVAGGLSWNSIKKATKKAVNSATNTASDWAHDGAQYVANNPETFVTGMGAVGAGAGAVIGGGIGLALGGIAGGGLGVGIGAPVGTGIGTVLGLGTVLICNEAVD